MKELAQNAFQLFGIRLTQAQLTAFEIYENELLEWNERFNLTAIHEREQIRTKHFLDSLSCLPVMHEGSLERVIDIGTGAGFPGLPLKIVVPSMKLILVESVGKKITFCQHMIEILNLSGVEVIQARAEALGLDPAYRQKFDWAIARAVAVLPVLAEYLLPLVRTGGVMLAMKGISAPGEAHAADNALRILGGNLRQLLPITLPGVADERYLVVIDKVAPTPNGYPRRVGLPAKKPL
jgi:16S rRNA (guanine527-N7)-methyltransferase